MEREGRPAHGVRGRGVPGDIGERNATYEVAKYAPGFLLVGDDSGGRGFLLRADDPGSAVFSSGLGDLEPAYFDVVAAGFASWIESLGPVPFC
ncbi:hypothetical protein [Nonomuraea sp. NPDC005692]|uniref:hypothetical protein n=1 Tax=Nonomuraea sp. NPDC005692 TaxID=3157168 RepID=UPI0033F7E91A